MVAAKGKSYTVVRLPQIVTYPSANALAAFFQDLFESGHKWITMDASDLIGIDSYGMGLLMKQWIKARDLGGSVRIQSLKGEPERRFREARILHLLMCEDTG